MSDLATPRVWITAFWGFGPTNEGYCGFTVEGDRRWFLDQWQEGNLILIYDEKVQRHVVIIGIKKLSSLP